MDEGHGISGDADKEEGIVGLQSACGLTMDIAQCETHMEYGTSSNKDDSDEVESLPSEKEEFQGPENVMKEHHTTHKGKNQSTLEDSQECLTPNKDEEDWVPKVGNEFDSLDEVKQFYNDYSRKVGFSIRVRTSRKNKQYIVANYNLCCSKEGFRVKDDRDENVKNHRPETRTGCMARMNVALQENGRYRICRFEPAHNHQLVTPERVHFLRSHRSLTVAQVDKTNTADSSGITPHSTLNLMSKQVEGVGNLDFIDVDYQNYLHSKRNKKMMKGDAGGVLTYFQKMQTENRSFYYAIQLDKDDLLTNMFWTDARMMVDYNHFGDVVCFDTTYKTNKLDRPFALFAGVNHHKQSIVFGAALLYDDTSETYKWLFQSFLKAMYGKQPKTILTDQDVAMQKAIAEVFPKTYHRLCVWHMYKNASKDIGHQLKTIEGFKEDFNRCIWDCEYGDEFIIAWNHMLEKYNLKGNKWLKERFEEKEKWSLAYGRNTFCADMSTTQRSDSINSKVQKFLNSHSNCLQLFHHFDKLLEKRRQKELQADFITSQSVPVLVAEIELLKHAVTMYTPPVFEIFQRELMQCWDQELVCCGETDIMAEYKVIVVRKQHEHKVTLDLSTDTIVCGCKKFEFEGILCSHVLKIFHHKHIRRIPEKYILKRWTKDAKIGTVFDYHRSTDQAEPEIELGRRHKDLCHMFVQLAAKAALSGKTYAKTIRFAGKLMQEFEEDLRHIDPSVPSLEYEHDDSICDDDGWLSGKTMGIMEQDGGHRASSGRKRIKSTLEENKNKNKKNTPNESSPSENCTTSMPSFHPRYMPSSEQPPIHFMQGSPFVVRSNPSSR